MKIIKLLILTQFLIAFNTSASHQTSDEPFMTDSEWRSLKHVTRNAMVSVGCFAGAVYAVTDDVSAKILGFPSPVIDQVYEYACLGTTLYSLGKIYDNFSRATNILSSALLRKFLSTSQGLEEEEPAPKKRKKATRHQKKQGQKQVTSLISSFDFQMFLRSSLSYGSSLTNMFVTGYFGLQILDDAYQYFHLPSVFIGPLLISASLYNGLEVLKQFKNKKIPKKDRNIFRIINSIAMMHFIGHLMRGCSHELNLEVISLTKEFKTIEKKINQYNKFYDRAASNGLLSSALEQTDSVQQHLIFSKQIIRERALKIFDLQKTCPEFKAPIKILHHFTMAVASNSVINLWQIGYSLLKETWDYYLLKKNYADPITISEFSPQNFPKKDKMISHKIQEPFNNIKPQKNIKKRRPIPLTDASIFQKKRLKKPKIKTKGVANIKQMSVYKRRKLRNESSENIENLAKPIDEKNNQYREERLKEIEEIRKLNSATDATVNKLLSKAKKFVNGKMISQKNKAGIQWTVNGKTFCPLYEYNHAQRGESSSRWKGYKLGRVLDACVRCYLQDWYQDKINDYFQIYNQRSLYNLSGNLLHILWQTPEED